MSLAKEKAKKNLTEWAGIIYILALSVILIPVICLAGINDELAESVRNKNIQKINELISRGADVNTKDSIGMTPLMYAAVSGKIETVKLLIDRGADVNAKDSHGGTPLMHAADFGHTETVKLLIDSGADVNAKHPNGTTPLMHAAGYYDRGETMDSNGSLIMKSTINSGNTETVKLLIDRGADVNAKANDGRTALSIVQSSSFIRSDIRSDIVALLKKAGAK